MTTCFVICFVISFDHQLWKFTGSLYNPLWLDRSYLPNARSQETPRRKCQPDVPLDKRQWLLCVLTQLASFTLVMTWTSKLAWRPCKLLLTCWGNAWEPHFSSLGRMDSASTGPALLPSPSPHWNQSQWQRVFSRGYKEFLFCTVINIIAGRF